MSYVDDEGDQDYRVEEEAAAKETTKGRKRRPKRGGKRSLLSSLDEEEEDMTVGDVFKLEQELNRENRKSMKVRKRTEVTPPPFGCRSYF